MRGADPKHEHMFSYVTPEESLAGKLVVGRY
jgi:hypothetical protein